MQSKRKFDVFFKGTLTAVQPISFSLPLTEEEKRNPPEVRKLPLMQGKLYLTASSIRGKIRRFARDVVYESKSAEKMNISDFYFLTLGGVKNAKDKDESVDKLAIDKVINLRVKNPLISLFGAMAPLNVPGHLMVSHAIEQTGMQAEVIRHVRTDDLRRSDETFEMLDENSEKEYNELRDRQDLRSSLSKMISTLKKEAVKASADRRAEINEEIKDLERQKADANDVSIQLPQLNYEVIPQGAVMDSSFTLLNVTEAELILFLKAMQKFAEKPLVGGRLNHGLGVVAGNYDVRFRVNNGEMNDFGTFRFDGDFMPATTTGRITEWCQAKFDSSDMDFSAKLAA